MSPTRDPEKTDFSLAEEPASAASPTGVAPLRPKRVGCFIPLTPEGTLDASRVRDTAAIEKVRTALGIKEVQVSKPLQINRDFIPQAYSVLEVIIQRLGKWVLKWPPALAEEMYFSPDKKEALIEPTALVIEKYGDKVKWLVNNQEIASLAMAFSVAVEDMVQKGAERYVLKMQAAQAVPAPPNGHAQEVPTP